MKSIFIIAIFYGISIFFISQGLTSDKFVKPSCGEIGIEISVKLADEEDLKSVSLSTDTRISWERKLPGDFDHENKYIVTLKEFDGKKYDKDPFVLSGRESDLFLMLYPFIFKFGEERFEGIVFQNKREEGKFFFQVSNLDRRERVGTCRVTDVQ